MDSFVGPTSIAYGSDFSGLSRVLVDFAKSNDKFTVLVGFLNGKILSDKEIVELSKMPSLTELMSQIVYLLQGAAIELHRVIDQISKQGDTQTQEIKQEVTTETVAEEVVADTEPTTTEGE